MDANAIIGQCPTPAEVSAIDRELVLTFERDPTSGRVICSAAQSSRDLTLLQAQTYRALNVTKRLTFDAPLPWTASSLYQWMVSSIHGIRFRTDISASFCCDPAATIDIQAQNLGAVQFPTDFRWVGSLMKLISSWTGNGKPVTVHFISRSGIWECLTDCSAVSLAPAWCRS